MTTEGKGRTITEPEAAALLSHFTRRPQPPRMRWAVRTPESAMAQLFARWLSICGVMGWMAEALSFVESGLTPQVQRGAVVGAVWLVALGAVFLRRVPESER